MKQEIKIFENGTTKEVLQRLLDEGYMPMTTPELVIAKKKGVIPYRWYDSGTMFFQNTGEIRKATKKELRSFMSGRLLARVVVLDGSDSGVDCGSSVNHGGCLVGVKKK